MSSPAPIEWHGETISVVSLGCGQLSVLAPQAVDAMQNAQVIFGAKHHFDEIAAIHTQAQKIIFPAPFPALSAALAQHQCKRVCVLASGDALFFGIGSWLNRHIGNRHLRFYPNISSVQACFHAIGLPWQDAKIISLHGRPLSSLRRYLVDKQLIALFTDADANPLKIAIELQQQGFGDSRMWVCAALGSAEQRISQYHAAELAAANPSFQALNVCIVALDGETTLPAFPGIADALFSTGSAPGFGMISKREARLSILALMQPQPGEVAWDIGAGCGSVSVEWARWNVNGHIYAIESSAERIRHMQINSERFGVTQNCSIIEGHAPACCAGLPGPDCIFIGGSGGLSAMLEYAWQRLKPGGKLVAAAVTAHSRSALTAFMTGKTGFEQVDMQITKNLPDSVELRTLNPVLVAKCRKPSR